MNIESKQALIDTVVQDTGVRLTRSGGTRLYSRIFLFERQYGTVLVALPINSTFDHEWFSLIGDISPSGNGVEIDVPNDLPIKVFPLGPVDPGLIQRSQEAKWTRADAEKIANTAFGEK